MTPTYTATYSGRQVDFFDPRPEQIWADDIAHALSLQCRYNGHTSAFYSVAEHCCRVAWLLRERGYDRETQLYGLLHDAAEAYLGDLHPAVKADNNNFEMAEYRMLRVIHRHFGLDEVPDDITYDAVHQADLDLLSVEVPRLFHPEVVRCAFGYLPFPPPDAAALFELFIPQAWDQAENIYQNNLKRLTRGL